MQARAGIFGVLIVLAAGILAMRWLAPGSSPVTSLGAEGPEAVRAGTGGEAPGMEPQAGVGTTPSAAATGGGVVELPTTPAPGTVWLDAPEVMEVGQAYGAPLMVRTSARHQVVIDHALDWDHGLLRIEPTGIGSSLAAGFRGFSWVPIVDRAGMFGEESIAVDFLDLIPLATGTVTLRQQSRPADRSRLAAGRAEEGALHADFHPCTIRIVARQGE